MQQEATNVFRRMNGRTADLELTPGNSFHIDDLLDFSNEELGGPIGENDYWANDETANSDFLLYGNSFSNTDYHCCASDFFVPFDEFAEQVEWISNFVENSKDAPLTSPSLENGDRANLEDSISSSGGCSLNAVGISSIPSIPTRPRSKRMRAARDFSSWYFAQSWTTINSSLLQKSSSNLGEKNETSKMRRRCTHCRTEKTPQWRAGPMGPKSLCNACGVRYKSGRLLPEYRPAASPTFKPSLHSNSHRNVLHIRRLKQIYVPAR